MKYVHKKWLLGVLVGISQCGFAQESVKSLIVSLNNPDNGKSEMIFALNETPKYWAQGEMLVIENVSLKGEFSLDNVKEITFAKAVPTAGVPLTESNKVSLYPNPTTEVICVKGISHPENITLTDLQGRSLSPIQESAGDVVSFNVSALPAATYLLHIDGQTFKFVKR